MADRTTGDVVDGLKIRQARIACPIGHDPKLRTQHRSQPNIDTPEKRGILRALYDLQARRESAIPYLAMVHNLHLLHDSLGEAARDATHFYVGGPTGLKEGTDPAAPRAAEQILEAPRVGIVDVVADGRTERRQTIERRFRLIMPEADIDIPDGAFKPINAPTLTTDLWKSGYVVFGVLQCLVQRVNYFVGEGRIDERPNDIFDAVHFDFNDFWIELTRSYMVGALCGRFHKLFNYYSLTAIEVPGRDGDYDPANRRLPPQVGRKKRTITIGELQDMESKGNAKAAAILERRRKRQRPAEDISGET
ncbi:hypothetical protein DL771_012104 [Monosporascus sp. 5C6A]|nr:hypothetical protein DL771_012104 [Monosporascus sp. 5C6A]